MGHTLLFCHLMVVACGGEGEKDLTEVSLIFFNLLINNKCYFTYSETVSFTGSKPKFTIVTRPHSLKGECRHSQTTEKKTTTKITKKLSFFSTDEIKHLCLDLGVELCPEILQVCGLPNRREALEEIP